MTSIFSSRAARCLLTCGLATIGLMAVLGSFSPREVQAHTPQPVAPSAPSALIAQETVETGQTDTNLIYNGDRITYTFQITNPSTAVTDVTNLTLLDFLPDFVQDIQVINEESLKFTCSIATCARHLVTSSFPDPTGGVITTTATVWISWSVQSLTPGEGARLTISGIVEGQADGATFTNRAFVDYRQGGVQQSYVFNEMTTQARVRVPNSASGVVSQIANWFSSDYGGTISQDWGDFDRDGYLDLALGSALGASVYRNVQGRLEHFADLNSGRAAYGVRWADVNGDGVLELIAVGDSVIVNDPPLPAQEKGINRVYSLINGVLTQTQVFTSEDQLVRVVAANFDRAFSGTLDLIASTNAINSDCPVQRFRNNGAGRFTAAECISQDPTAALSAGDFDNDGYPDLVLGRFPNSVVLAINHTGTLTTSVNPGQINSVSFDTSPFLPYDFAWGDYDGDGYLDLAAGYPLQRQARIYHNRQGNPAHPFEIAGLLPTRRFMTPLAIDWTDFNHDGALDLLVADAPARVYLNDNRTISPRSPYIAVGPMRNQGQVWSARAVIIANNETNIALSNQNGPSAIFAGVSPRLIETRSPLSDSVGANSVAWGDFDGDGLADLLFGAGASSLPTRLHLNQAGRFSNSNSRDFFPSGFGPHRLAVADLDNNGTLEAIIGAGNNRSVDAYSVNGTPQRIWTVTTTQPVNDIAAGDINSDGYLDLLVALQNGPLLVYQNRSGTLDLKPSYTSTQIGDAHSVAWYDFNRDYFMDFAVGYYNGPVQVYSNKGDNTFKPVFTSTEIFSTTSVAWGDANGDGSVDLAVGTDGQGIIIYPNLSGTIGSTPLWTSVQLSHTTSLAWGDWNNDGRPDLAASNDGEPDVVYANLGGTSTIARFALVWSSAEAGPSTQVAWGDADLDGYLDLAVSRSDGSSGVYYNRTIIPAQFGEAPTTTMRYPHNPVYVSVQRPGQTRTAYFFSSSELLSGYFAPTVTIQYKAYSVNDTRTSAPVTTTGTPITGTVFEYSLDSGATWKPATAVLSGTVPVTQPTRGGAAGVFIWDAQADKAISDYALFRVRVTEQHPVGPVQQAANAAVSPPFRVRGTTCVWPSDPQIYVIPSQNLLPGRVLRFVGVIGSGSGSMIYNWNFGDGGIGVGQTVTHTYSSEGTYTVTLSVNGAPCPTTRPITAVKAFAIGLSNKLYLPLIARNAAFSARAEADQWMKDLLDGLTTPRLPDDKTPASAEAGASDRPQLPYAPSALQMPYNTPIQLTTARIGYNNEPAINGDGTRVAYWSTADFPNAGPWRNPDGNVEIFLAEIEPASQLVTFTQVTSSTGSILGGFNFSPAIDDAGDRIVFFSDRDLVGNNRDQNFEIFLAKVNASGATSLTQVTSTTVGINVFPSINMAGDRIAFVSDRDLLQNNSNADLNPEIFIAQIAPDNSVTFTQVTSTSGALNDQPMLDGNGDHIAFISDEANSFGPGTLSLTNPDRNQEIFIAALEPDAVITFTQITSTPLGVINDQPSLGDTGNGNLNVAYVTGDNISRTVRVTNVDAAGNLQPVDLPGDNNDQPRINTGDGTRVIATSVTGEKVNLLDAVNHDLTSISSVGLNNTTPAISADGMRLAFASSRQIYVAFFPIANLSISKATGKDIFRQDEAVSYTMVITNNGPMPAPNVVVTDDLSQNLKDLEPPTIQADDTLSTFNGGFFSNTIALPTASFSATLQLQAPALIWPLPDGASGDGWINMSGTKTLLHFDAGLGDSSGSSNIFTCSSVCPVQVSGKVGIAPVDPSGTTYAYAFDGATMAVTSTAQNGLDFDANTSFSLMMWVKTTAFGTEVLLAKHDSRGYILYIYGGVPYFYINGNNVVQGQPINDNQWHLIVATLDRTANTAALYVDGQASQIRSYTAGSVSNSALLDLGFWLGTYYYAGSLDEVAIFARALSAAEVLRIYQYQLPAFRAGYFTSRVMDGFHPSGWNQLSWRPERPSDKELPNAEAVETAYPLGNVDLRGNILLMHLNEPANSVAFADTSGHNNNGICLGPTCPTTGVAGKLQTGVAFSGSTYISLTADDVAPPWTAEFWVNRQNTPAVAAALLDSPQTSLRLEQTGAARRVGVTRYGVTDIAFNFSVPVNTWTHLTFVGEISGTSVYSNGVKVGFTSLVIAMPMQSLGARSTSTEGVRGTLDEVALYQRALTPSEIITHYQRNAWRVAAQYQVRTCAINDCSDRPPFLGPGGQPDTFYSDLLNATPNLPTFDITPPINQYFQYRVYLENELAAAFRPVIISTTVEPPHNQAIASQGGCGGPAKQLVCSLGALQPGEVATITLPSQVVSSAHSSEVINTAFVSSAATDHTPDDNQATVTTPISASLDLSITAATPAFAVPGEVFSATFIVTSAIGSQTPTTVTITTTVANANTVNPTSNGGPNTCRQVGLTPNFFLCTFADISPAAQAVMTLTVTTGPEARGQVTFTAQTAANLLDANPANNLVTTTVTLRPRADLAVSKRAIAPAGGFVAGREVTYTLTITNLGSSTASGIWVTDTLPVSVTFRHASPAPNCGSTCARDVIWSLPTTTTLNINSTLRFTVTAYISPEVRGVITNVAQVSGNEEDITSTNNIFTLPLTAPGRFTLEISKDVVPSAVVAGDQLTFTLAITNQGPSTAFNITTTDIFQTGLVYVSGPAGCVTSSNPERVNCVLAEMNPGARSVITLVTGVANNAPPVITNTATATSTEAIAWALSPVVSVTNSTSTSFVVRKAVQPEPARPDDVLTYTLRFTNTSGQTAYGVNLVDDLPTGVTYNGTVTAPVNTQSPLAPATGTVRWVLPTLENTSTVNYTGTIIFTATVPANSFEGDLLPNTVTITSSTPYSATDNTATVTTTVQNPLQLSKTSTPAEPEAGKIMTYTLIFTNLSVLPANPAVVTDVLPAGVTYVGTIPNSAIQAGPTTNTGLITWTMNTGRPNAGETIILVFTATPGTSLPHLSVITNSARITGMINSVGRSASASVTNTVQNPLLIRKDSTPALAGEVMTYTLTFTNVTGFDAVNALVTDLLPTDFTYSGTIQDPTNIQAYPTTNTGLLTWTLQTNKPNAGGTITLIFTGTLGTSPADQKPITNSASLTGTIDAVLRSATASVTNTVINHADLGLAFVSRELGPISNNERVTYTLAYSNAGPVTARGTTVAITLTNLNTLVTLETLPALPAPACNGSSSICTWAIGSLLGNSANGTIRFYAKIATGSGTGINVSAHIDSTTVDNYPANNTKVDIIANFAQNLRRMLAYLIRSGRSDGISWPDG